MALAIATATATATAVGIPIPTPNSNGAGNSASDSTITSKSNSNNDAGEPLSDIHSRANQVKGCGLLVAIMAGGFQYCPQCRAEVMLARQLGKTVLMVRVEDFAVSETWLQHQLGIPVAVPHLLHSLPSCNTWFRASRRVRCCLPPPYSANRRPPVVTDKDDYEYFLLSDGCPAGGRATEVVLDSKALGGCWVPQRDASRPHVNQCVQDRSQIAMDIIRGPLVIDFRPAPELAGLEAAASAAAAALAELEAELQSRWLAVRNREAELAAAKGVLDAAKLELERAQERKEDWVRV